MKFCPMEILLLAQVPTSWRGKAFELRLILDQFPQRHLDYRNLFGACMLYSTVIV